MPACTTVVDLLRHGEPVGGRRYRGQTDDPLSETGWVEMRRAVADHCPWHVVVSSPLKRCLAFAEDLSRRHGLPVEQEPRFMELGFGIWEGRRHEDIEREDPQALVRFYQDPIGHRPEGAEPLDRFRDRIAAAWADTLARHGGKHVLVVGHAGTIRMVVAKVLDLPDHSLFRIKVASASLTRIDVRGSGTAAFSQLVFLDGRL